MVGDRVFRVNGENVYGLSFNTLNSKLEASNRPLQITFVRAQDSADERS